MKVLTAIRKVSVFLYAFVVFLAYFPSARAEKALVDGCRYEYRVRDLEEESGWALKIMSQRENKVKLSSMLVKGQYDGKDVYILEREEFTGEGHRDVWKYFLDKDKMGLLRVEKETISASGKKVRQTWVDYTDPMFDYPANLCHINTIAQAVRVMELSEGSRNDFYLLLSLDSSPLHMFMVMEGSENVTVPAGTFECFRLRLEPDYKRILGSWSWSARILKPFVPEYKFWVEKEDSHNLILFTGRFGPVGAAPIQAHELINVECAEKN